MNQSAETSPVSSGDQPSDLHILGRLCRKFPAKAAKRAVWAFSTPPRLPAPAPLEGLEPRVMRSREGLRVLAWGEEGRRKVLLVHGWGLQAESMQSFVPGLLERNFQVLAFDGLAHGHSPGARATGADFARSILALSEEFEGFHAVIGHSVGGAAASIAMGRGAAIKRAALLAPAYLPEIVDNFVNLVDLTDEVKPIFMEQLAIEAQWPLEDWRDYNLAGGVHQPVIVFHDPADKIVSIVHSRRYIEMASQALLLEVEGGGHNSILVNRDVVNHIVYFLDSE